jgi:hypothetical protein
MKIKDIDENFLKRAGLSDVEERVYAYYLGLESARYRDWVISLGVARFSSILESAEEKVQAALRSGD